MFNEMPTLQSANQHRQSSWSFDIKEEGSVVTTKREEGRPTNRTKYKNQCKSCGEQFFSESKNQPYCSSKCYGVSASAKKLNPLSKTECIRCLSNLGFGSKIISRKFYKVNHCTMRNWIKKMGFAPSTSKISATRIVHSCIPIKVNPEKRRKEVERQRSIRRIEQKIKYTKCWAGRIQAAIKNCGPNFDWRNANKSQINYWANLDQRRKQSCESSRNRWKNNLNYRIKGKLRNHINRMIRMAKQKKSGRRTTMFLGVPMAIAKQKIESRFRDGMTWENHGELWEIDHIVPLSHFDLTNEYQLLMSNHISNLQPLLKKENREKSDNFSGVHQFELISV
jgi:hypothetical protein